MVRGITRPNVKAVPVTANLYFGFKTQDLSQVFGLPSAAIAALGQVDPAQASKPVAFGCNAPKAARFRYKLEGGARDSVSTFGNGLSTQTAIRAGWKMTKPIREVSLSGGKRLRPVAIPLSNGLYVVRYIPRNEVNGTLAQLLGWSIDPKATIQSKLLFACSNFIPAQVSTLIDGKPASYPCKKTRIPFALKEGWKLLSDEVLKLPTSYV
jgi:hypothetical protein